MVGRNYKRRLMALCMPLALLAGCGGDSGHGATTVDLPGPKNSRGAQLVVSSGCLGCHRLGSAGTAGGGPDLTHIAQRIPRAKIAEALMSPTAPMPSYQEMPRDLRAALVDSLTHCAEARRARQSELPPAASA